MHRLIIGTFLILLLCACGAKAEPADNADDIEANAVVSNTETENTAAEANVQGTLETNSKPEPKSESKQEKPVFKQDISQQEQAQTEKEGYKVTFLEIGAESCIPCRMMQPIMKEIAEEYPGVVEVIFHDLYKDRTIGQKYGIRVMPTQVFLDADGREFFRHEGFYPKTELKAMLDRYLATLE